MATENKVYFKITNQEEKHYGLQYKNGIIEDILPFNNNPRATCCEGGIYFSDEKNIIKFFTYGPWIRQVEIPEGAQWIQDPSGNKWRASKLFFHPRKKLWSYKTLQWLFDNGVDVISHINFMLEEGVRTGSVEVVKFFIDKNIIFDKDYYLIRAAAYGDCKMAKFLLKHGASINDSDNSVSAFCCSQQVRNDGIFT